MFVLTAAEMRAADARASARIGATALMRAAGAALAARVRAHAKPGSRIVVFAGPGNNGGDGFAACAELAADYRCTVYADAAEQPSPARADAQARALASKVDLRPFPETDNAVAESLGEAPLLIDAMFGTGSRLPIAERYHAAIRACDARRFTVLAADLPSGLDSDSGNAGSVCVRATETVAFAAAKPGLLLEAGRECCGALYLAEIGILDDDMREVARTFAALDDASFRALLPQRAVDSDKRRSGAPLLFAGSEQFPGAAVLCARGAARAGAGYVTVVTPARAAATLRAHLVEQVVVTIDASLPVAEAVQTILDLSKHNGSIAIGPGLGLDERTGEIVRGVLFQTELPVVADASALFHLAKALSPLRRRQLVVTPHASEFARLSGKGTVAPGERVARLREFVERTGIKTLLKGNATLIYGGEVMHINTTGSNALATAGTGDVLTGIIATLLAQGLVPEDAARAGAYWHGLAARYVQAQRHRGVVAGDVADALGFALGE